MKTTNLLSLFLRPAVRALAALACPAALAANVALPAAPTSLSSAIQSKIALWLRGDANLVADASGNVVAWCDAREDAVSDEAAYAARVAAGSWTYPRAVVYKDGAAPSDAVPVGADAPASFGGKPYVDFGEYNDNRWMLFVDAAGARKRVPLVGYAGYIGFGATAGFVVGDVNKPDIIAYSVTEGAAVGANGRVFFHKGAGGRGDDVIFSASTGNNYGTLGETRLNGHVVNPTSAMHVRNGWETFVQNGPNASGLFVSTLFNNGNAKTGYMENLSTDPTSRQGGGKIAEIMLFSEMLTQEEVAEVEAYLRARWQGGSGSAASTLALAAGDTLSVSAAAPAFVGDIAGAGAIEKTGSSSLTIDRNGRLAAGALALREGSVVSYGKRAHHAPLLAIGGKTVTAVAATLSVRDAGDADTFTLNESTAGRRVALAGAESGVAKVAVTKAAVVLAPPALPPTAVATVEDPDFLAQGNLIQNGSFESDTMTAAYKQGITPSGWTRTDDSNTAATTVGITTTSDTTAWLNGNGGKVAEGNQACFLQVNGISPISTNGIQQTVEVPASGLYRLSLAIRCRQRGGASGTNSLPAWVAVDGVNVLVRRPWRIGAWNSETGRFETDTSATEFVFKRVSVDVALSSGNHVVAIKAVNHDGLTGHSSKYDRALLVDDIRLDPVAPGDFVLVPDAGFDSLDFWHANEINSVNGGSFGWSRNPFWSVSGGALSRYPSTWFCNPAYADGGEDQQAALQNGATATQTISFPRAGRVRVSLRYANRSDRLDTGASRTSGQTVVVSIGGTQFDSRVVSTPDWRTLVAEGDVAAGDQALSIESTNIGTDTSTIIDDVRIEYVGTSPRIVEDATFAANSSTWTLGDGVAVDEDAYGLRELVFTNNATATLSFTAPSNGTYLLSFQSRGRPLSESGTDGVYHNYHFYSHNLNVRVDDAYFANYYNEAADIHPVEMRLPYLAAGAHTLTFAGSCEALVRETAQSRISDVTVTPLATGTMADWSGVEFDLADEATIAADLGGKVRLGKLKVAGVTKYGEFTAANSSFVTGAGTVEIIPEAFVLVVR